MSRSGVIEDDGDDPLASGRYQGRVASAVRGKRGQSFLCEMVATLDAMPLKELIAEELVSEEGDVCAIGAVCKARGLDTSKVDYEDPKQVAGLVGIAESLVSEIEWQNDRAGEYEYYDQGSKVFLEETPAQRWQRMRKWVESRIRK